jgi:hypothetical protein
MLAATPPEGSFPVPLGSATWWWNGDAINALVSQSNGTMWMLNCGTCAQGSNITFLPANSTSSNNYSYLSWANTVPLNPGCR